MNAGTKCLPQLLPLLPISPASISPISTSQDFRSFFSSGGGDNKVISPFLLWAFQLTVSACTKQQQKTSKSKKIWLLSSLQRVGSAWTAEPPRHRSGGETAMDITSAMLAVVNHHHHHHHRSSSSSSSSYISSMSWSPSWTWSLSSSVSWSSTTWTFS